MSRSKSLYNADLAPTPSNKKNWGWFEIFNVWANDVQSLFGYTLAASLFIDSGLNGWAVFLALIAAGLSLIFGLMDIVNFAHGEHLMLSMFSSFWLWSLFGLDPIFSIPITILLMAFCGIITHYFLLGNIYGIVGLHG